MYIPNLVISMERERESPKIILLHSPPSTTEVVTQLAGFTILLDRNVGSSLSRWLGLMFAEESSDH